MKISPARQAAFGVLRRIEKDRSYSGVLLPQVEEGLGDLDRRLCHNLVLGTLRSQILLDRFIDVLVSGRKLDTEVRIALRMGIYQLRELTRVPAYSVVNESINLVQKAGKTSAKGLVNAVLRKAAKGLPDVTSDDPPERISVETSHPKWLIERWVSALGVTGAQQLARANNTEPPIAFRVLRPSSEADDLVAASRRSRIAEECFIASGETAALAYQLASEGFIYIQDEASQLVAHWSWHGSPALDVCAAPGGKAGIIANKAPGVLSIAGDIHSRRVGWLKENLDSQGVDGTAVVQYNAEIQLPFANQSFRTVLVDAPCSGTGTIRRSPEIRYFLVPTDLEDLPRKQLAILRNASNLVRTGGRLTYSTCSMEPEENEAVASAFLDASRGFRLIAAPSTSELATPDGFVRTWPHLHGADGFFAAQFERM